MIYPILSLYERGYSRENILELFRLIDWIMTFPDGLEEELLDTVYHYQEERKMLYITSFEHYVPPDQSQSFFVKERKMPYITSFERLGRKKGRQEERQETIVSALKARFGDLDDELSAAVELMVRVSPDELIPFR